VRDSIFIDIFPSFLSSARKVRRKNLTALKAVGAGQFGKVSSSHLVSTLNSWLQGNEREERENERRGEREREEKREKEREEKRETAERA
jgi:hypothetical protein